MNVELTVRGEIEVLKLQPGDVIVVNLDQDIGPVAIQGLHLTVTERFPAHEVIVCARGVRLAVQREAA